MRSLLEVGARATERASSVVNISTVSSLDGLVSSIAYAASKAALNTLTLGLARELEPLIRVSAVCPGYTDTPWWVKGRGHDAADRLRDVVKGGVLLRVAATAEDIAAVVTFSLTRASRHMTGSSYRSTPRFGCWSQSPHETPGVEPLHGVQGRCCHGDEPPQNPAQAGR